MSLDFYISQVKRCPHCGGEIEGDDTHDQNITHNLAGMADAAGLYKLLWRPEENGIVKAGQLIEPLQLGIALMEANPERFRAMDAENGWGTYDQFVPWLKQLLTACREYPDGLVRASR
jgi:hypothetical protein